MELVVEHRLDEELEHMGVEQHMELELELERRLVPVLVL